jgi:arsenite-transporting ATPase
MRIVLFTGKGGVGKTTLAAATALCAARRGSRTLVVSTDAAHSLADSFAVPLANEPRPLGPPGLFGAELDAGEELERYWGEIKRRLAAVLSQVGLEAPIAGELAIVPGLDEILSLVRIKKIFDQGEYDLLVIDSAPTGSAMRLLGAPELNRWYIKNMLDLTRGMAALVLPVLQSALKLPVTESTLQLKIRKLFDEVEQLRRIFIDPQKTSVRLVLNPDRMALLETERAFTFFSLYNLTVDAVFVNRVLPDEITDPFLQDWKQSQTNYRRQIAETFAPLPIFEVPLPRQEVTGLERISPLAETVYGDRDPRALLVDAAPLRFELKNGQYTLTLRLAGVEGGAIELEKAGDELRVRIGKYRRTIALPQYVAGLKPAGASLDEGCLKVLFSG